MTLHKGNYYKTGPVAYMVESNRNIHKFRARRVRRVFPCFKKERSKERICKYRGKPYILYFF